MLRGLFTASLLVLSEATLTDDDIAVMKIGSICAAGPKKAAMGPVFYVGMAGDKTCTNLASAPAEHIQMHTLGSALIDSTDTDGTTYMNDDKYFTLLPPSGAGYFSEPTLVPKTVADNTTPQYAFFSFGTDVGDTDSSAFGYVGMAAYAMVQGELSFQTNEFMVQGANIEVCAVPNEEIGANTTCGTARKIKPGDIKYSLYGYGAGAEINEVYQNVSFLAFRSKVVYSTMGIGASVTFNDGVKASAIGTTQIDSFQVDGNTTTLSIDFPQWFNYGMVEDEEPKLKGSAQVQIRHVESETAGEFYIDYLFAKSDNGIGQHFGWFVYDPTIAGDSEPNDPTVDDSEPTTTGASIISGAESQAMSVLVLAAMLGMQV